MVIRDIYLLRQSDEFYLQPGHEAAVDLDLQKAPPPLRTKLFGQVVSGCGPVSGATVKILNKFFTPLYHTDTDGEGKFSVINTLTPGVYEVVAAAGGYLVSDSRLISLAPSTPLYVTIHLNPDKDAALGTVYGMTRDEKNASLPGVQVHIFGCDDMAFPKAVTVSSPDGEYLVYGLAPGKYVIKAFLEGYLFPYAVPVDIDPKEIVLADLYLYRESSAYNGTISGIVTHNGLEVPHAMTALYSVENDIYTLIQTQTANSKGFYLFSGCKPGKYVVKAKLEGEHKTLYYDYNVD